MHLPSDAPESYPCYGFGMPNITLVSSTSSLLAFKSKIRWCSGCTVSLSASEMLPNFKLQMEFKWMLARAINSHHSGTSTLLQGIPIPAQETIACFHTTQYLTVDNQASIILPLLGPWLVDRVRVVHAKTFRVISHCFQIIIPYLESYCQHMWTTQG